HHNSPYLTSGLKIALGTTISGEPTGSEGSNQQSDEKPKRNISSGFTRFVCSFFYCFFYLLQFTLPLIVNCLNAVFGFRLGQACMLRHYLSKIMSITFR